MEYKWIISIFAITLFFSFGVQSFFYLWYKKYHPEFIKKQKYVFQYISGVVGDGLLVPLVNIFAVSTFDHIKTFSITGLIIFLTFLGGFLVTYFFHYSQQRFNLTNWTMPKKGVWNLLGLYHAAFMFFESSFLIFTLLIFFQNVRVFGVNAIPNKSMLYAVFVLVIFLLSMIIDYWDDLFKNPFLILKEKAREILWK